MSAEEMASLAAAAQASLAQSVQAGQMVGGGQVAGQAGQAGQVPVPAGETQPAGQQAASGQQDGQALAVVENTAGPWANDEDKPPSVLRAEIKALIIRNEFLETVANEQAQKIFMLEEHLRNQSVEMQTAVERVHIAEAQAVRAREAQATGHHTGLMALAASIVPGGPSSARQLGRDLAQQVGIQFPQAAPGNANAGGPPSWAKWPGDAQAQSIPGGGGGGGGGGKERESCWFFENGGCAKGAKCPFRHDGSGGGGGGGMQSMPMGGGGASKSATPCWNFVHEGKCEYGDGCRFTHPGCPPARGAFAQPPPPEKKSAVNCWHFVNLGTCEYGDGCRFVHPVQPTLENMFLPPDEGRPKRSRFTFDGPG